MEPVRSSTLEMVFNKIDNGFVFEKLAQRLMGAILETEFIPVGGIHDRGIDGIDRLFEQSSSSNFKTIHQFSISSDISAKIRQTIETLKRNGVKFDRLAFATNSIVTDIDHVQDKFLEEESVFLQIRDLRWFDAHINNNAKAIKLFESFVEDNLHSYHQPGSPYQLVHVADPRYYIYLRQVLDRSDYSAELDELLVDTLILLGLEGTNSAENILMSKEELLCNIESITSFDPTWLEDMVDKRLTILSRKPVRKIRHHEKEDKYCLPYETRIQQAESQNHDKLLYESFKEECRAFLQVALANVGESLTDSFALLERVFHDVFSQQGLEFTHFFQDGSGDDSIDKSLVDIVSNVVDSSSVRPAMRRRIKQVLLEVVRKIIYDGSENQLEFLSKLSSTYRMLFLVQCDPKLVNYFEVMADKLNIYVDTSILIPAMSEYFLPDKNKRYTNLLICARDAGIKLKITETVLDELEAHFKNLKYTYNANYRNSEDLYRSEDVIIYVRQILMRAYFYAKRSDKVRNFRSFYETFVSWNNTYCATELVEWLKKAFGVRFEHVKGQGVRIDPYEADELFDRMKTYKNSDKQARNDVEQLLTIYAIREQNNELGENGVFGYSTWWLTSDTITQRAFSNMSNTATRRNPYIRADFLYNYIALAPSKRRVGSIFKKLFPTLLGVNMSFHIPDEICDAITENMNRHKEIANTPAFEAQMRSLTEQIKSDTAQIDRQKIVSWFDQRAEDIARESYSSASGS